MRYSGVLFFGCTLQSSTYLLQHANLGRFSQLNIVLLLGVALFLDVFHPKTSKLKTEHFGNSRWHFSFAGLAIGTPWFWSFRVSMLVLLQDTRTSFVSRKNGTPLFCLPALFISFVLLVRDPRYRWRVSESPCRTSSWICLFPFVYADQPLKLFSEGITVLFLGVLLFKEKVGWQHWILLLVGRVLSGLVLSLSSYTNVWIDYGNISVLQRFGGLRHILLYKIALAVLASKGLWSVGTKEYGMEYRIAALSVPFCLMLKDWNLWGVDIDFWYRCGVRGQKPPLFQRCCSHSTATVTKGSQITTAPPLPDISSSKDVDWTCPLGGSGSTSSMGWLHTRTCFLSAVARLWRGKNSGSIVYNQNMHLKMIRSNRILVIDPMLFPQSHQRIKNAYRDMAFQLFGQPVYQKNNVLMWDIRNWNGKEYSNVTRFFWPNSVKAGDGNFPISSEVPKNQVLK